MPIALQPTFYCDSIIFCTNIPFYSAQSLHFTVDQLEAEGKIKPVRCRKWKEKTETINRRESRTDPESGFYKR